MKIIETRVEEVSVVTDIICNRCGKSLVSVSGEFYGLIEHNYETGYESPVLPDGHIYKFSICETCLTDFFSIFKIPPEDIDLSTCSGCGHSHEEDEEEPIKQ